MSPHSRASATSAKSRLSLPLSDWPAKDRAAWLAALDPEDPFKSGNAAKDWRPATLNKVKYGYGYWLAWLASQGLLDPAAKLDTRISRDRAREYLAYLRCSALSDNSAVNLLNELGHALQFMVPGRDWRWILRAANRIERQAVPVRDKASRLQSPLKLIALGERLMAEADTGRGPVEIKRAIAYRDGLLIAFLAYRPLRRKNLTEMVLGQHLTCRNGSWWVEFTAAETKAKRPLGFAFPAELTPHLERYLAFFRPVLLAGGEGGTQDGNNALWVSACGTHMACPTIVQQVTFRTKSAFGRALGPHLFRDSCATWIAIFDPTHVRIITAILGHATLRTSEKHYNLARRLEAGDRYHVVVEGIRGPARYKRRLVSRTPAPPPDHSSDRHSS